MELGKVLLRRNGINALAEAIHPKYGLAWTDGRGIYLVPVSIIDDEVEYEGSIKLGEFEYVQSIHWSSDLGNYCYMCVVHEHTVSIWKVYGNNPDLQFKQVRKINVSPISQGVLWSPSRDILCILCRDQCSFYFRHTQNKGSFALPPIESGRISAGCWSEDGEKLIMGIGSIILIYQWKDIDRSISEYTIIAWKIPNVEGRICATTAVSASRIICTAELPLESLCQNTRENMFVVPDLLIGWPDIQNGLEENNLNKDEGKDKVIRPHKDSTRSLKDNIMQLQRTQNSLRETSQLILFEIQGKALEPAKLASINIKGVIAPELLYYDAATNHVVVGCNTQNVLQVFQVHDADVLKVHEIHLGQNERPKGLCGVTQRCRPLSEGVLALVGRTSAPDTAFLPASIRAQYDLKLRFLNLLPGYNHESGMKDTSNVDSGSYPGNLFKELQLPSGNARVHLLRINPIQTDKKMKDSVKKDAVCNTEKATNGDTSPLREIRLPMDSKKPSKPKIMVLDGTEGGSGNLDLDHVDFSEITPKFNHNFELNSDKKCLDPEPVNLTDSLPNYKNKVTLKNLLSSSEWNGNGEIAKVKVNGVHTTGKQRPRRPAPSPSDSNSSSQDPDLQQHVSKLESQLKVQGSQIIQLQERIEQISRMLEESACVPSSRYRPADSPEVVNLIWQSDDLSTKISKSFILDNGRLQLEPVKQAFSLASVELVLDGMACVLGANVDGYIPVKFTPNTTMYLTGKRTSPLPELRGSPKYKR